MAKFSFRRHLSMPGMMRMVRSSFQRIPDPVASRGLTQSDCLMSGLAVFLFKFPSLPEFDKASRLNGEPVVVMKLKRLFKIGRVPSDTSMRERLDRVDPGDLRRPFTRLFAALQRGKVLESFKVLDRYLVISIDGTGYFSSSKIKCKHCCETNHKNGSTTWSHKLLGAVLVHPDHSALFPLAPEMITRRVLQEALLASTLNAPVIPHHRFTRRLRSKSSNFASIQPSARSISVRTWSIAAFRA